MNERFLEFFFCRFRSILLFLKNNKRFDESFLIFRVSLTASNRLEVASAAQYAISCWMQEFFLYCAAI
jgi:hypothetical protein